jgi:hypothetical protein
VTFHGDALNVAAASDRVAWTDSVFRIHVKSLRSRRESVQAYGVQYWAYGNDSQLTFAGSRPAWLGATGGGSKPVTQRVWSTSPSGKRRLVDLVAHDESGSGTYVTALAGSPAGGAFGVASLKDLSGSGCFCEFLLSGGGVWAFGAGSAHRVPGLPPPALLARWGGEVALVPVDPSVQKEADLAPAPDAPVEVRSLTDASTISSFTTPRPLYDLELTDRYVFTIVGYGRATQIQVHDPATGALVRSIQSGSLRYIDQVGVVNPPTFAAAGSWLIFGEPHSVWAVDGTSGTVSLVTHTLSVVRDVSTDGRSVTWAEAHNVRGTANQPPRVQWLSRIRTATIP